MFWRFIGFISGFLRMRFLCESMLQRICNRSVNESSGKVIQPLGGVIQEQARSKNKELARPYKERTRSRNERGKVM